MRIKNQIILIFCIQLQAATLLVGGATAATLREALSMAYANSPALVAARARLRAQDEGVAQARSQTRPQIQGSASVTLETNNDRFFGGRRAFDESEEVAIQGAWNLYDGGLSRARIDNAEFRVFSARAQLESIEQDILLTAVIAYLDVLRDTRLISLSEESVRITADLLDGAERRYAIGQITRTVVAETAARLATVEAELVGARGNLLRSEQRYFNAIGEFPNALSSPADLPEISDDLATMEVTAIEQNPAIEVRRALVSAADEALAIARAAGSPTVSLNVQFGLSNTFADRISRNQVSGRNAEISLNVIIPLYAGGRYSSTIRQALAEIEDARAQVQIISDAVRQAVNLAWTDLSVTEQQIRSTRRRIAAAQAAYEAVLEESRLGARPTIDVLDRERDIILARSDLIIVQHDNAVAGYELLFAMGRMTYDHLQLDGERYDPAVNFDDVQDAPFAPNRGEILDVILRRY